MFYETPNGPKEPEVKEEKTTEEDDFELDENGDIIIPEFAPADGGDEDGEGEPDESESEDADADENEESDENDESDDAGEDGGEGADDGAEAGAEPEAAEDNPPPTASADVPDEKDKTIAELTAELERLKECGFDALKKLGVQTDDVLEGLAALAAEAEGKTREEYEKERDDRILGEKTRIAAQKAAFEEKMKADLLAVQAAYPDAKKYQSVKDFPNFTRFGQLRDAGASPVEAYIASHPTAVKETVAAATRQKALNDTKAHLNSVVPKSTTEESVRMPQKTYDEWKELFPDKTRKEIEQLYRETL